jgi:hypothetical protein
MHKLTQLDLISLMNTIQMTCINIIWHIKIQDNILKKKSWIGNILDWYGSILVNLSNLRFGSWNYDNPI